MKLLNIIILLFLAINGSFAQKVRFILDNDSSETNQERIELHVEILSDVIFEQAADIGSGNMKLILSIANAYPDKKFYLEDIDSSVCNTRNMFHQIRIMDLNEVETKNINIQYGDTNSTHLPNDFFDLVVLAGLIHEFDNAQTMLDDVKRIMRPTGKILISDPVYKNKPPPHYDCKNPFLTEEEFESILKKSNISIIKDWRQCNLKDGHGMLYDSRIVLCYINED